jgi:hypothetical protein
MIFIWGQKTYCRKSVNPVDIGFPSMIDNIHITRFELTQRYGHLYWIPLFPMSLKWHARAGDGKLYTISPSLEYQLKGIKSSPFSLLFAFAWPILIFGGMFIYNLMDMYKGSRWQNLGHVKEYNTDVANEPATPNPMANSITNPMAADYYHFLGAREQFAKLIAVNDTAILLSPAAKVPKSNDTADIRALFTDTKVKLPQVWVSRKTLLKMAEPKSDFDTALFGPGELYLVEIQQF